ncbi:DUF4440 domain-containing protein [Granulicella sp. S190]|uniref:nuclear transport factor 2 family protein n=1 Tax=Granulicella sp. S190 TaxID=1747226 RepID=UPI00131A9055|nr:nuclear transport factor 2 family protein [Granulicella sp. S190]
MNTPDHLRQLEERLLDPAVRRDPELVSALLTDDFVEFGSSGRVFDKTAILEDLQNEPPRLPSLLSDFSTREISPNAILATWKATRRDLAGETIAQSWRSSLWLHLDGRWQIAFHQGTPIPPPANQHSQK